LEDKDNFLTILVFNAKLASEPKVSSRSDVKRNEIKVKFGHKNGKCSPKDLQRMHSVPQQDGYLSLNASNLTAAVETNPMRKQHIFKPNVQETR
jgi:hypothetical protein